MPSAEMKSDTMEMERRFSRSSSAPPMRPASIWGTAQMSTSVPAASASPVRASSTSGSTTPATELPNSESALEVRNRMVVLLPCMGVLSVAVGAERPSRACRLGGFVQAPVKTLT